MSKELGGLRKLVEYSRKNPDRYDWRGRLNEWEQAFALQILDYSNHIEGFQPTDKQQAKIVAITEKMTIPLTGE